MYEEPLISACVGPNRRPGAQERMALPLGG